MAEKYKIKITKAYLITIEDKDGYEIESDWSFLDYKDTKFRAECMLERIERCQNCKWHKPTDEFEGLLTDPANMCHNTKSNKWHFETWAGDSCEQFEFEKSEAK